MAPDSRPRDGDRLGQHRAQIDNRNRLGPSPVQSAGIEYQGRPNAMLFRHVRVAVADKVMVIGLLQLAQDAELVAVREGDLATRQLDLGDCAVAAVARPFDRFAQPVPVRVYVSEDKGRGELGKQLDRDRVRDVAAVQDVFDP